MAACWLVPFGRTAFKKCALRKTFTIFPYTSNVFIKMETGLSLENLQENCYRWCETRKMQNVKTLVSVI